MRGRREARGVKEAGGRFAASSLLRFWTCPVASQDRFLRVKGLGGRLYRLYDQAGSVGGFGRSRERPAKAKSKKGTKANETKRTRASGNTEAAEIDHVPSARTHSDIS